MFELNIKRVCTKCLQDGSFIHLNERRKPGTEIIFLKILKQSDNLKPFKTQEQDKILFFCVRVALQNELFSVDCSTKITFHRWEYFNCFQSIPGHIKHINLNYMLLLLEGVIFSEWLFLKINVFRGQHFWQSCAVQCSALRVDCDVIRLDWDGVKAKFHALGNDTFGCQ